MATIDINQYIEQSGMRKARFGGYEPDDVRQAMLEMNVATKASISRQMVCTQSLGA